MLSFSFLEKLCWIFYENKGALYRFFMSICQQKFLRFLQDAFIDDTLLTVRIPLVFLLIEKGIYF